MVRGRRVGQIVSRARRSQGSGAGLARGQLDPVVGLIWGRRDSAIVRRVGGLLGGGSVQVGVDLAAAPASPRGGRPDQVVKRVPASSRRFVGWPRRRRRLEGWCGRLLLGGAARPVDPGWWVGQIGWCRRARRARGGWRVRRRVVLSSRVELAVAPASPRGGPGAGWRPGRGVWGSVQVARGAGLPARLRALGNDWVVAASSACSGWWAEGPGRVSHRAVPVVG